MFQHNHTCNLMFQRFKYKDIGFCSIEAETWFLLGFWQVYIQYDLKKSNADMALDYGFIEPSLDRNAFTLTLEISESDEFYAEKLDIAELNGSGVTAYFDIKYGQTLPRAMLQYLRLVALGGQDAFLLESIFSNKLWEFLELPVSRANEELICRVVRNACKSALSAYPTTIEEVTLS